MYAFKKNGNTKIFDSSVTEILHHQHAKKQNTDAVARAGVG